MISLLEENEVGSNVLPFRSWPLRIARVLYDNGITTWPQLSALTWNEIYSTCKLRERDIEFLTGQLGRRGLTFQKNPPAVIRTKEPKPPWIDYVRSDAGVYFVQCGAFVKIGVSNSFEDRMKGFVLHNPMPLVFLARFLYKPSAAYKKEQQLHQQFAKLHHRGEWFRLEQPIYDYLETFRIGASEVSRW